MNVEINFLDIKVNRKLAPYVFTLLIVLVLSLVVGAIYFQGNTLNNEIADNKKIFAQLEESISEYQVNSADQRNLIQLQKTVDDLILNSLPSVSLYQNVRALLDNEDQLKYYQQNSQHQFMLETSFADFISVSAFVTDLLELSYVTDVHLDSVNRLAKGYEANITVTFDERGVKKELSKHE